MRADLLVIFRIGNDTFSQSRVLSKDKVKAYSTCEVVIVDTRAGLVPFMRVVGREHLEAEESSDLDLSETLRRAERIASTGALKAAGDDLAKFLRKTAAAGARTSSRAFEEFAALDVEKVAAEKPRRPS